MDSPSRILMAGAKQGDARALEALMQRYERFLFSEVNALLPDKVRSTHGVEDVVQEVRIQAVLNFSNLRGETPPELIAWLREICWTEVQKCIRYNAAGKRDVSRVVGAVSVAEQIQAHDQSPSKEFQRKEFVEQVKKALNHNLWIIVELRMATYSFPEIAEELEMTENQVKGIYKRAIERLREHPEIKQFVDGDS